MSNNFPCKCGHGCSSHRNGTYPNLPPYRVSDDCRYRLATGKLCLCSNYTPDNLRYLELIDKREEMKNENLG
jgi:hypothetical protein